MDLIRVAEIMATHPKHEQRLADSDYAFGSAFVADHFCPIPIATIPIYDSGFLHADAVYDVVSVSRGCFFRLDQHQARFARSCDAIRVRNPFSREREAEILHELVTLAGLRDAYVWWTVTRGVPPMGRNEMVKADSFENRFYGFATPFVFLFGDDHRARGIDLIVSRDRIRIPPPGRGSQSEELLLAGHADGPF